MSPVQKLAFQTNNKRVAEGTLTSRGICKQDREREVATNGHHPRKKHNPSRGGENVLR